jgi:hypothetical protein
MKQLKQDLKYAELSRETIQTIRDFEKQLGDICLIAVHKADALFVLEAKMAPNEWMRVDEVYPEIENLKAYFSDEDTAKLAKGALKSFLGSHKDYKKKKRPIRIRKIDQGGKTKPGQ